MKRLIVGAAKADDGGSSIARASQTIRSPSAAAHFQIGLPEPGRP